MAIEIFDSTGDTTVSTGTGTLTGSGTPPTGYRSPSSAGISSGTKSIVIRIETSDGTTWEVCESTYTVSGTTYTRGTLLASSTGSAINFAAGTKNIYFVAPKELLAIGALTTSGDILYHDGTKLARLATGTSGQPLLAGTPPSYGTLAVAGGGTGAATLTAHGVVIGNGTSAVAVTSAGTSGQVLTSNGASADPTFQTSLGEWSAIGVVATGGFSTSSTSPVDITGLTLAVDASSRYFFEADLFISNNGDANGCRVGADSTGTGPNISLIAHGATNSGGYGAGSVAGGIVGVSFNTSSVIRASVSLRGWIDAGTGTPTISIRIQKQTSGTVNVLGGSIVRWRKAVV